MTLIPLALSVWAVIRLQGTDNSGLLWTIVGVTIVAWLTNQAVRNSAKMEGKYSEVTRVWVKASMVMFLANCGVAIAGLVETTEGESVQITQSSQAPDIPTTPLPYSGQVRSFTAQPRVAPFQIRAAQGSHFLVKLVNAVSKSAVLTVFVHGGKTVDIKAPLGTYEVRYAAGDTWYGDEVLFGPDTSYSKADKTFAFRQIGNEVQGFTITLYKVRHGNLATSQIDRSQF